ncbi:Zinc finger protein NUTCRACKER [Dendrobium catenatum]|uniref:Protein EARLY HEADING DATE 2 n=1 Tax=Dendrobium catenatum TaxID=906689 RepID=A0A2I0X3P3_9ASPA|nr:Zinc finger protein NUTCRACKER [Dendrobium catenatum]
MKGFAVKKTLDIDVCSDPTASDHQACLSSIPKPTRKRRIPGTLDPNAEVIALSPKSLLATNKFICEVCGKGFQRDQNLQLHRRGHNLPWKLKQRQNNEVVRRKVYICPEPSCSNHLPSRALGDLTGIKKHFFRKHGEKRWSCDKCSKKYAVLSDWKAHSKICGSKEYRCECGTIVSRRDSFITHKAFCEVLALEKYTRTMSANQNLLHLPHPTDLPNLHINNSFFSPGLRSEIPQWLPSIPTSFGHHQISNLNHSVYSLNSPSHFKPPPLPSDPNFSATALLQKAAEIESTISRPSELHSWLSSNSQEMSNGVFELGSSVSSPLQFHPFPSCSGFGSPFEETVGGQLIMSPKRGERSAEDFLVGRNIVGDQGGRDETTRDFLGLRVPSHEELFSLSGMETCMGSSSSFG